jgi:hypothetical protein
MGTECHAGSTPAEVIPFQRAPDVFTLRAESGFFPPTAPSAGELGSAVSSR